MKKLSNDRRVRKTRAAIEDAFMALMKEKDINKITVTDITERADVNRGTFYIHYMDIYDLLDNVEDRILREIESISKIDMLDVSKILENENEVGFNIVSVLEKIQEGKEIFKRLLSSGGDIHFYEKIKKFWGENFVQRTVESLDIKPEMLHEHREYLIDFHVSGIIGILKRWLDDDTDKSTEYIVKAIKIIEDITLAGIREYINK